MMIASGMHKDTNCRNNYRLFCQWQMATSSKIILATSMQTLIWSLNHKRTYKLQAKCNMMKERGSACLDNQEHSYKQRQIKKITLTLFIKYLGLSTSKNGMGLHKITIITIEILLLMVNESIDNNIYSLCITLKKCLENLQANYKL